MKTLVVLTALAAVAVAGPTARADVDFDDIKVEKRSPHLKGVHYVPAPTHILPVHHTYVQPIIPHHLGLKKPLHVKHPYGHHVFRSAEEQVEAHSSEAKESKKTCMKEMESKCDDEIIAKSSESDIATKVEDIDGGVSDREVAQSLKMAKEAVEILQKKLQEAEKNPKMKQWKHGETETDSNMHQNVETAKIALEHMQRNFGNLESMNVHARAFTNAELHDANLKLESARSADNAKLDASELALKNAAELKTDEERLAQWKDAIENIQKNVELVRNIEDSFQLNKKSEKSAVMEESSSLKHEIMDEHKQDGALLKEKKISDQRTSDIKLAQNIEKKSTDGKSSWQAREQEKSTDSKNEMETSASTLSESKIALHSANEQKAFRNENTQAEKSSDIATASNMQVAAEKLPISQPSLKSSEKMDMKNAENEMIAPVDTTTFMKSAEHHQAEDHKKVQHFSSDALSSNKQHAMSSQQHEMSAVHHQAEHSHNGHEKLSGSFSHPKEALDTSLNLEHPKDKESRLIEHGSVSNMHGKDAHETMMKSSDLATGQSQLAAVAMKPAEHMTPGAEHMTSGHRSEKLHHSFSHGSHGKSAEDGGLFAPIEMKSAFKEALVPTKSWKEAHGSSRGAYGAGAALAGLGSSYSSGYGGSGAVGVFPNAHVGGCAIPLLLSCSPNVVAGHLAKSHSYAAPSYAASAYRGSENHNSHSKRDVGKLILKRNPAGAQQKSILITDKL